MESQEPKMKRFVVFEWRGRTYTALQLTDDSPADVTYDYLHLGDGWRVNAPTVGERCELAGLATYDAALPQAWWDEHQADITRNGGYAVWEYPDGNLLGRPVFAAEIERRAKQTAAAMIAETLELIPRRSNMELEEGT